jgi:peptide/nickel transport system permease protein
MTESILPTSQKQGQSQRRWWERLRSLPASLLLGGAILIIYVLVAIFAEQIAPYTYNKIATGLPFSQPSLEHLLGTDQLGRDVFSRVVYGTRYVLVLSLAGTTLGLVLGGLLGLISGYVGGWFDETVMRISEVFISIPFIVLGLVVIAAAGPKLSGNALLLIGVIAIVYAPRSARMARAVAMEVSTRDFITVARLRGEKSWSIALRELLPMATGTLLVEFAVRAGYAPVLIGSLGFLGFGAKPPIPEWGLMISENRSAITIAPWTVLGPGIALALLVVGLNFCTEGLARVLGRSVQRAPV